MNNQWMRNQAKRKYTNIETRHINTSFDMVHGDIKNNIQDKICAT